MKKPANKRPKGQALGRTAKKRPAPAPQRPAPASTRGKWRKVTGKAPQRPPAAKRAQSQRQRDAAQAAKDRRRSLAGFRPKAKDRGKILFLTPTGKRAKSTTSKKIFAVYVTKTGRKKPLKPSDLTGAKAFRPHAPSTYNLSKRRDLKRARKEIFAKIESGFSRGGRQEQVFTYRREKIDFALASKSFARYLADRLADLSPRSRRLFQLEVIVTTATGKTLTGLPIDFGATFGVNYTPAELSKFCWGRIWAEIGELLTAEGLIAAGSARYIRNKLGNSRRRIAKFKDKLPNGEKVQWRHATEYNTTPKTELVSIEIKTYLVRK